MRDEQPENLSAEPARAARARAQRVPALLVTAQQYIIEQRATRRARRSAPLTGLRAPTSALCATACCRARARTGERPFRCRAFTTKGNLKTHMGTHCIEPQVIFTNALVLQHIRLHTGEHGTSPRCPCTCCRSCRDASPPFQACRRTTARHLLHGLKREPQHRDTRAAYDGLQRSWTRRLKKGVLLLRRGFNIGDHNFNKMFKILQFASVWYI